jgi:putative ABC transport system permease protein
MDLRLAGRRLCRDWRFSAAAVATLALGIGGNAAIFAIVERFAVLPLPFPRAGRLVRITDTVQAAGGQLYRPQVLPWHWQGIASAAHSFDRAVAISPERWTWIGGEAAVPFQGAMVSAGTLDLLGVEPIRGRLFTPDEERLGLESGAAVVSDRFWKTRLGGREDALGGPLRLADRTATIVGILPPQFRFPYGCDVWSPLVVDPNDTRDLFVVARLAPGARLAAANIELANLARRQEGGGPAIIKGRGMEARFLKDAMAAAESRIPLTLMAAVGFLLLLSCANLASLLLVRSVSRQRERAIRAALGAGRARQVREALAETVLMACSGGAIGLFFASLAIEPLSVLVPRVFGEDLPVPAASGRPEIALFACLLSLATALVVGFAPALGRSDIDPAAVLGGAGRSSSLPAQARRLLNGFVAGEVALATVLLAASAVMGADFWDRQRRDLGLRAANLYAAEIPLVSATGQSGDRRRLLVQEILRSVARVPGVSAVAATTGNPFSERRWGARIAPAEKVDPGRELSTVNLRLVTPGLFATYGTRLVAGRDLSEADRADAPPVAVVSRGLARRFWGDEDPIGKTLVRRAPDGSLIRTEVVGVVGEIRELGDIQEALYLPYMQLAGLEAAETVTVMARSGSGSAAWTREIPRLLNRIDQRLGLAEAGFMDDLYRRNLRQNRAGTAILAFLGGFAVLLAAIGILATVSFVSLHRRSELGIRSALGATPRQIRSLVLGHGLRLSIVGCLIGLPLALAANRVLASALTDFRMRPLLCAAVAAVLMLVTVLASDGPARRAANRDPLRALRSP